MIPINLTKNFSFFILRNFQQYNNKCDVIKIMNNKAPYAFYVIKINEINNNSLFWDDMKFRIILNTDLEEKHINLIEKFCIKYKNNQAFI